MCRPIDHIIISREYSCLTECFCLVCLSADGKVYALGGMGADTTPQALVRVYEAEKDQWQPMTSIPTPRYGATAFVKGNKIYMMGRKCDSIILLSMHSDFPL